MKIILLIASLLAFITTTCFAYDGITFYGTQISQNDRFNSNGQPLTSVRAILRQDRTNYYKNGGDSRDQRDGYFSSKSNRAIFNSAKINISPSLANRIVSGGPVLITVFVLTPNSIEVRAGLPTPGVD